MIGSGPDVQDAVEYEAPELTPAVRLVDVERSDWIFGAQHRSGDMAMGVDGDDAAMVRIDVLEQVVVECELIGHFLVAQRCEENDVIRAVSMIVDHLPFRGDRTGKSVTLDGQCGQRIALDDTAMRFDLAPRDPAVVVAVDADGKIQIAQRYVPLAVQLIRVARVGTKRDVRIALFVRERDARQQCECHVQCPQREAPAQRSRPGTAAWASSAAPAAAREAGGA